MAGDWIKMRVDLADDPAVIGMASMLKTSEHEIIGFLHSIWAWADKHTSNGFIPHVSEKWIDKHVGKNGIAKSMCAVGWLECYENGVTIPRFDRHNGESAKSRAEATERKRLSRKNCDISLTESGHESRKKQDENVTREEKRREDSKPPYPAIEEVGKTQEVTTEIEGAIDPETGEVIPWAA